MSSGAVLPISSKKFKKEVRMGCGKCGPKKPKKKAKKKK